MKAKELQDKKTTAEIQIMKILDRFNALCVKEGFQVEELSLTKTNTDKDRAFDVDIHIV